MRHFLAIIIAIGLSTPSLISANPIINYKHIFHPVSAKEGMVASQEKLASEVGLRILKDGGNAIDAAVAVGFALAVTLPRAGNIGGGGFMLIHIASENQTIALDYREKAPLLASKDMFLGPLGSVDKEKSRHSLLATGVPGTVYGLTMALEKYGSLPLKTVMQPAIDLARNGFDVSPDLAYSLNRSKERMQTSTASMAIFYKEDGSNYESGELLLQTDLANSLTLIAENGRNAFYEGPLADKITRYMADNDGLISTQDLKKYSSVWRSPIQGRYRGYDVYSMPAPSSGGVHLVQILNLIEPYPLAKMGHNSAQSIHILAEAMKLAYADRSKHLGDPDFVDVPATGLTSKTYANRLRKKIKLSRASQSQNIFPGNPISYQESNETTHFSVVDRWGNAVSNTYTLNFSYGNHHTVPGTGILLNNQMDDFSAKPGSANAYGLIGGAFNAIEPEKRMLSSMTPTIILKDGYFFMATGSPGGSRIISTVLQAITNVIDYNLNIAEATFAPRIHHQWLPDVLRIERGLNKDTISLLQEKGHQVEEKAAMGSLQSIIRQNGLLFGVSDSRKPGALTVGY